MNEENEAEGAATGSPIQPGAPLTVLCEVDSVQRAGAAWIRVTVSGEVGTWSDAFGYFEGVSFAVSRQLVERFAVGAKLKITIEAPPEQPAAGRP